VVDVADPDGRGAVRRGVDQARGRLVTADDDRGAVLATFDGPARAIRCAKAILDGLDAAGRPGRAGLHSGECEVVGDRIGGVAVQIATRVMSLARPGQALVSRT